ncbi:hypothetical protein AHF37_03150 [Paragonimus kellicotti]|nr:hypothetical protein AHF37_03150 [Paragonimus kellicotti]
MSLPRIYLNKAAPCNIIILLHLPDKNEAKLLKLAMDYYTAQRREKLHAARLELLKRIKIAEDDAEKLREGRYSEIPLARLTIYRKRCRAFGIADVIGQRLGLEPLPPGTDSENEAIRNSVAVPELLHTEIGEEIVDGNGGTWFPLHTTIREVFSESEKHSIQASMSEYLRAQAILSRRIGTELPEDETSSVDTLSSVQTHPDVRDVCRNAIWSLSSCKPGHGIDQLLDESTDTFWQSDGPQPHCVYIQFPQKITLTRLCLYTDYKADESYTPSRLAVRVGNTVHDLIELVEIELQEPTGWSVLPLSWPDGSPVRTFLLQLAILANHQNGRDTHLRAIRLHSPIQHRGLDVLCPFDSQEGRGFMSIR